MPFAEEFMIQGSFIVPTVATGAPALVNVNTGFLPTRVTLYDETQFGTSSANENIQIVDWSSINPTATKITWMTASATTLNNSVLAANGISQYDGHSPSPNNITYGPAIAGTTITKAATPVFTVTSTATLQVGSLIQITNDVVFTSLGGMILQVATIPSGTTFTVTNGGTFINTANFQTGGETGFSIRLINVGPLFYPPRLQIVGMTAANPLVITFAQNHNLTVGQQVRINVPKLSGMVQANGLQGAITATTASTITIGSINSTSFSAFTFPGTAVSAANGPPYTPATVVPIGAGAAASPVTYINANPYNQDLLDDSTTNQQFQGFTVGTSILQLGAAGTIGVQTGDLITYTAWRASI